VPAVPEPDGVAEVATLRTQLHEIHVLDVAGTEFMLDVVRNSVDT